MGCIFVIVNIIFLFVLLSYRHHFLLSPPQFSVTANNHHHHHCNLVSGGIANNNNSYPHDDTHRQQQQQDITCTGSTASRVRAFSVGSKLGSLKLFSSLRHSNNPNNTAATSPSDCGSPSTSTGALGQALTSTQPLVLSTTSSTSSTPLSGAARFLAGLNKSSGEDCFGGAVSPSSSCSSSSSFSPYVEFGPNCTSSGSVVAGGACGATTTAKRRGGKSKSTR